MTFPNIRVYVEVEVAGEKYHDIAHIKVVYQTCGENVQSIQFTRAPLKFEV